MATWYKQGSVIRRAIPVGPWTELVAVVGDERHYIGTVRDGHLIVEARLRKHRSSARRVDTQIPAAKAVEFRGIMEEVHRENLLLALNRDPDEVKAGDPLGRIDLDVPKTPTQFFTLRGRRAQFFDADITSRVWDYDRLAHWLIFDGPSGDEMRISGTSDAADFFDPVLHSGNITVLAEVEPVQLPSPDGAIIGKWKDPSDGSWMLYYDSTGELRFIASEDGTYYGFDQVRISGLQAGVRSFVGGSYRYVTDGTSIAKAYLDGSSNTNSAMPGPVYSTTNADVVVAKYDAGATRAINVKIYWCALYDAELPSATIEQIRIGAKRPEDAPECYCYFDGSNTLGSTYDTEFPETSNFTFTVSGSPTRGGDDSASKHTCKEPQMEFCLWKCRMSDLLSLGSGDEVQGVRFKAKALSDVAGDFGGSAAQPYGWMLATDGP
jgi:hypothetical protein